MMCVNDAFYYEFHKHTDNSIRECKYKATTTLETIILFIGSLKFQPQKTSHYVRCTLFSIQITNNRQR